MLNESSGSVRVYYPRFDRRQLIQKLREELKKLEYKLPLTFVVLFGSYARGNYTAASDVDLLVVYEGERREDAFATVKKTISVPRLEPHVYSEREYDGLKGTLNRMIEDGVVLYNEENIILNGSFSRTIDLSDQPTGIYYMNIESGDEYEVRKVMIQR